MAATVTVIILALASFSNAKINKSLPIGCQVTQVAKASTVNVAARALAKCKYCQCDLAKIEEQLLEWVFITFSKKIWRLEFLALAIRVTRQQMERILRPYF